MLLLANFRLRARICWAPRFRLKDSGHVVLAVTLLTLAGLACSESANKEYLPKADELCCHGNWKQSKFDEEENSECAKYQKRLFRGYDACGSREFVNVTVRPGEPDRLSVAVATFPTELEATNWLDGYEPEPTTFGSLFWRRTSAPGAGEGNPKAWEFGKSESELHSIEVAFRRKNIGVVVGVYGGILAEREVMVDSVDQAILYRLYPYD